MLKSAYKNRTTKRKGALHYNTKKYSNPFFQNNKKRKLNLFDNFSLKLKLSFSFILAAILILPGLIFYSDYFKIQNIEINGEGRVPVAAIEKIVDDRLNDYFFALSPKQNIFLFDNLKLIKKMEEEYSFDYVNIEKIYPRTIRINFKEKKYSAIWQEQEDLFFVDFDGAIITMANIEDKKKNYPIIINNTEFKIFEKKIGIKNSYIHSSVELYNLLKKYEDQLNFAEFELDSNEYNSIKVRLVSGPSLYFSIANNLEKQVDKLMIVKNEKLKDDFFSKEYIDIRIGDHVYFK